MMSKAMHPLKIFSFFLVTGILLLSFGQVKAQEPEFGEALSFVEIHGYAGLTCYNF